MIIQRVGADWIETHHAVGQKHGRTGWFEQNAYIADGWIDILDLCGRVPCRHDHSSKNCKLEPIRTKNAARGDACDLHSMLHFNRIQETGRMTE